MALDKIILVGDQVMFDPAFGPATVVVKPGKMKGKGKKKGNVKGVEICVVGDEKKLKVPGCLYTAGAFSVPGTGSLLIKALQPDQKGMKMSVGGKPVILKGKKFIAEFKVLSPALTPPPANSADPMKSYPGTGAFMPANMTHKGS